MRSHYEFDTNVTIGSNFNAKFGVVPIEYARESEYHGGGVGFEGKIPNIGIVLFDSAMVPRFHVAGSIYEMALEIVRELYSDGTIEDFLERETTPVAYDPNQRVRYVRWRDQVWYIA